MPEELSLYIIKYGYLAIFGLVFLQEIGIPNPVPNELILLFSGYLSFIKVLSFPLIFLTAVAADFIGTATLYTIFYLFGKYFLERRPNWLPFPHEKIHKLREKISAQGKLGIFFGRLIPYVRGYISVAAGLLEIKPKVFLITVLFSAITWSGGYVILGNIVGPYWQSVAEKMGGVQSISFIIGAAIIFIFVRKYFAHRHSLN